jgi:hypothetical protein
MFIISVFQFCITVGAMKRCQVGAGDVLSARQIG